MDSDNTRLTDTNRCSENQAVPGTAPLPTMPKTAKKRPIKSPVSPLKKRQKSEESGISIGQDEDEYIQKKLAKGQQLGESTEEEMTGEEYDDDGISVSGSEATRYSKETENDLQLANLYMLLGKVRFLIKNWIEARDAAAI